MPEDLAKIAEEEGVTLIERLDRVPKDLISVSRVKPQVQRVLFGNGGSIFGSQETSVGLALFQYTIDFPNSLSVNAAQSLTALCYGLAPLLTYQEREDEVASLEASFPRTYAKPMHRVVMFPSRGTVHLRTYRDSSCFPPNFIDREPDLDLGQADEFHATRLGIVRSTVAILDEHLPGFKR